MVTLGDMLHENRGWSKRKVELLRLSLIIGLYIFFIYIAFNMVWTDQQCKYLLPTGDIISVNLSNPVIPLPDEFLVNVRPSSSNCSYVTVCHETLTCNVSGDWSSPECWRAGWECANRTI
jgi:hypothetical protein